MRATTLLTAYRAQRSEGEVWRYNWEHTSPGFFERGTGEKEAAAYTFLRDHLGATRDQALAVIEAAKADALRDEL